MATALVLPGFEDFLRPPAVSSPATDWRVEHGDCLEILRAQADSSIDSMVTDPPAGIGFMGKAWDGDKGGRDAWTAWLEERAREALRVLKPGAHGLVWALPRTSHWTATALEDAGFEVRDVLNHLFGTGFPKSLDLGDGRGTALKPGAEHWILVRKPCDGTTTANMERWGTGGLEIDACRLRAEPGDYEHKGNPDRKPAAVSSYEAAERGDLKVTRAPANAIGRWPAHVLLSHDEDCSDVVCVPGCAVRALDDQAGVRKSGSRAAGRYQQRDGNTVYGASEAREEAEIVGSTGPASRFFYCAKPSPSERELGCDALPERSPAELTGSKEGAARLDSPRTGAGRSASRRNHHPTVKSIELMRWLCRLVTPPGGIVIDPFCGSGSTGCAAVIEGLRFVGIDQDAEYVAIARARIAAAAKQWSPKSETPAGATVGVSGATAR